MRISWEITHRCNLRCKHCYTFDALTNRDTGLPLKAKLDLLKKISTEHPGATLHLLGGEPLLSEHFVTVLEHAFNLGLKIDVTTNGSISDQNTIQALLEHTTNLYVSIDAHTPELNDNIRGKGSYAKASDFLQKIVATRKKSSRTHIVIAFTLTQISLPYAKQIIGFCINNNVDGLIINIAKPIGNALRNSHLLITPNEHITFLEQIAHHSVGEALKVLAIGGSYRLKEHIKWSFFNDIVQVDELCGAGKNQLALSLDGKISTCIADSSPIDSNNIIASSSSLIKSGEQLRKSMPLPITLPCNDCKYHKVAKCYGGCGHLGFHVPAKLCTALLSRGIN